MIEAGKIVHGRVSNNLIGGPYVVMFVRDGRASASCSGIQSAAACNERAREYSRSFGAPIVTPDCQ